MVSPSRLDNAVSYPWLSDVFTSRYYQDETIAICARQLGWDFLSTVAHLLGEFGVHRTGRDGRQVYQQIFTAVYIRNGSSGGAPNPKAYEQHHRIVRPTRQNRSAPR